jgi:hypothetical protein
VWSLHKRIVEPTKPHEVSFDYKDKTGNLHSMTLEMDAATADRLFWRLQQADAKKASAKGGFWGDSVWKTHRNEAEWKPSTSRKPTLWPHASSRFLHCCTDGGADFGPLRCLCFSG